jgi:hypothetical protein
VFAQHVPICLHTAPSCPVLRAGSNPRLEVRCRLQPKLRKLDTPVDGFDYWPQLHFSTILWAMKTWSVRMPGRCAIKLQFKVAQQGLRSNDDVAPGDRPIAVTAQRSF